MGKTENVGSVHLQHMGRKGSDYSRNQTQTWGGAHGLGYIESILLVLIKPFWKKKKKETTVDRKGSYYWFY
jgi:hypothetical protein